MELRNQTFSWVRRLAGRFDFKNEENRRLQCTIQGLFHEAVIQVVQTRLGPSRTSSRTQHALPQRQSSWYPQVSGQLNFNSKPRRPLKVHWRLKLRIQGDCQAREQCAQLVTWKSGWLERVLIRYRQSNLEIKWAYCCKSNLTSRTKRNKWNAPCRTRNIWLFTSRSRTKNIKIARNWRRKEKCKFTYSSYQVNTQTPWQQKEN